MTTTSAPKMPIGTLVYEACGDPSADYNDGDHCGYYRVQWSETDQTLRIVYEPDTSDMDEEYRPPHAGTVAVFRLVAHELAVSS